MTFWTVFVVLVVIAACYLMYRKSNESASDQSNPAGGSGTSGDGTTTTSESGGGAQVPKPTPLDDMKLQYTKWYYSLAPSTRAFAQSPDSVNWDDDEAARAAWASRTAAGK